MGKYSSEKQCCRSGMFIPDTNFFHSGSRIRIFPSRIQYPNFFHPGSASKNLSILTQKNCFLALRNMVRVVHPHPDPDFLPSTDPGSGSATLQRSVSQISRNNSWNSEWYAKASGGQQPINSFCEIVIPEVFAHSRTVGLNKGNMYGMLSTTNYRSNTICIWPDSEPTKLLDHPKQRRGPQTDKHLPESPFEDQLF